MSATAGSYCAEGITAQPLWGAVVEKLLAVWAEDNGAFLQIDSSGRE